MNRVKVVHIITRMELGGAQQNTLFTVRHLNPDRFLAFLVFGPGGELFEDAGSTDGSFCARDLVREVNARRDLKALLQITALLKRLRRIPPVRAPLIVHTHSSKAGILGRWAARVAGIPLIVHSVHGFGFHDYQPLAVRAFYVALERLTARVTTRFITVSRANRDKAAALKIFKPDRAALIRSGIDIARFQRPTVLRPQMRVRLGLDPDVPVVAMVACLKPQKAPLDFVQACAGVRDRVPEARFLLVGDGELRGRVACAVRERGLQDRFRLLGWRDDIPEIMHAADVFALSSLWEGLPRVLPQAMAAGLPIVATNVDGTPEAVEHGVNGFLVRPGDTQGLCEKITWLLTAPGKASEMGRTGAARVREFDIFTMVRAQEDLYSRLVEERFG